MSFAGEAHKYLEWKANVVACLRVSVDRKASMWGERKGPNQKGAQKRFEEELGEHAWNVELAGCCFEVRCRVANGESDGNVQEASRMLMNHHEGMCATSRS